jgi:hypothetical protein
MVQVSLGGAHLDRMVPNLPVAYVLEDSVLA